MNPTLRKLQIIPKQLILKFLIQETSLQKYYFNSASWGVSSTCNTVFTTYNDFYLHIQAYMQKRYGKTISHHFSSSSSVCNEEVTKFSSMASTWWDPSFNPLISMNPTRMYFIVNTLRSNGMLRNNTLTSRENISGEYKPLKNLKILDVGCGGGLLSESLSRLGSDVIAIDPSVESVRIAQLHALHDKSMKNIVYLKDINVKKLVRNLLPNNKESIKNEQKFDVICVLDVIEHIDDLPNFLCNISKLLKKPKEGSRGGIIFISTINRTLKSYVMAILCGEYILRKLPVGTHSWTKFITPNEVNDHMIKYCSLKEVEVNGLILEPPFMNMKWRLHEEDFGMNWIGAYRFVIG